MNRTKIEWCDYTVNPVKGLCPMACSYCYARAMYKRFGWNPGLRYDRGGPLDILWRNEPEAGSRIFVGSTMELFGEWIRYEWLATIFRRCVQHPKLTFIFLTKQPQNLQKWSPFPDNCWVGVSVCDDKMLDVAVDKLEDIQARVKFMSFEPLLERLTLSLGYAFYYSGITWAVIGQQTPVSKKTMPRIEWIAEIVEAADNADIPVFLKDNLLPLFEAAGITKREDWTGLRQEIPAGKE